VASTEQSTGIEQVNKALNQMDEVTQQNSALVEENAATAKTLEHQAKAMDERVAFFRIAVGAEDVWPAVERHSAAIAPKAAITKAGAPKSAASKAAAPKFTEPKFTEPKPIAASATKPTVSDAGAPRSPGKGRPNSGAAIVSRGPVARMQAAIAEAMIDPEWKEF
jgi:hypothetical protein